MRFPIADAHCDFLYSMYQNDFQINQRSPHQAISTPYLRDGGVKLQFFACWIDRQLKTPCLQQCLGMIDAYYRILDENTDIYTPLKKDEALGENKIATVLTVEGGEAIEGDLAVLRVLKRLGVAAMTLTWNFNNELAGAAVKRNAKGLSQLGRDVVKEMERLNIALDVSHLSDAGIDDALSMASRPIFASHSNARDVFPSPRSLNDAHIKAIASMGGVVGVNFYYKQLCGADTAGISDIVKHILHIVKIGGPDCCVIGSDFDGMSTYPDGLANASCMQALALALVDAGLSEEEVFRICYSNLYSFIIQFV